MSYPLFPELELVQGDITHEQTDAIVNAANSSLLGGGGVDGAIHCAGGPDILEECKALGGCETGSAKYTRAGKLPTRYVVHTVGPIYRDGTQGEAELLASCYENCIRIANELQLTSISFPSISTGAYGYPVDEAAAIALRTIKTSLDNQSTLNRVRFVLFDGKTLTSYQQTAGTLFP